MDMFLQCGSTTTQPILDKTNYTFWKARVGAFLKFIEKKCLDIGC